MTTATTSELPTMPALKKLGQLADLRPVVIVDSREQEPLPISRLPVVRAGLQSADYSFQGGEQLFGVERNSIADLVACCVGDNRARLERELHRLRGFRFARLLIVGRRAEIESHQYRSAIKPAAVLGSLAAWEVRYSVAVVWADTPAQAAALVEGWVWWFARQMVEDANALLRGGVIGSPPAAVAVTEHVPATRVLARSERTAAKVAAPI